MNDLSKETESGKRQQEHQKSLSGMADSCGVDCGLGVSHFGHLSRDSVAGSLDKGPIGRMSMKIKTNIQIPSIPCPFHIRP